MSLKTLQASLTRKRAYSQESKPEKQRLCATVSHCGTFRLSINLYFFENGVAGAKPPYRSSAICATASCRGFVWLTASILAWSGAVAPHSAPARTPGVYAQRLCTMQSQQSIHNPSPRGRGLGLGI